MRKINKSIIIVLVILSSLFLISCKKKNYIVVFDYNYNHILSTQEVKEGEKAILPSNPTRDRYYFRGWYLDSSFTKSFDENMQIKENTTLYALWEGAYKHTIRYNLNGGTVEGELTEEFVDANDVTLPIPTKPNYEFIGWFENGTLITKLENRDYFLNAKYSALYGTVEALIMSPIREQSVIHKDITYKIVGGEELKLDMYLPALEAGKTTPVIFMYFGGGFIGGDKSQVASESGGGYIQGIFDYVLDNNIAVIIPNYRLSNGNTVLYPSPVEDALDAVRFCVKNSTALGIDVHNMGAIGYSSGAYMALMTAFAQDTFFGDPSLKNEVYRMKYVVDLFAPSYYDKSDISAIPLRGRIMLTTFFGGEIFLPETDFSNAFPSTYVGANSPSVFIVHGNADSLVPVGQSIKFYNLLQEKKIESKILLVDGADHMLTLADGYTSTSLSIQEVYNIVGAFIVEEANE